MAEIKFYRGLASKYSELTHRDGIYFTTDTHEIIHNGISYGIETEVNLENYATIDFVEDSLLGFIREFNYDESTGLFSYEKRVGNPDGTYSYEEISFSLPLVSENKPGLMSPDDKYSLGELLSALTWNGGEELLNKTDI